MWNCSGDDIKARLTSRVLPPYTSYTGHTVAALSFGSAVCSGWVIGQGDSGGLVTRSITRSVEHV